eukprot:Protomagalhaensia_wolfi_Nauph_80__3851@NODE_38_length_4465_cov_20_595346_g30_i0_p3_GENE_NODE_38_length_4465_cov_20_595346_g30_i0NODE_38_length_4465_cov_20_595346_g30_i0_p3_ORF_typecomplete_len185_score26_03LIN37/PF15306_6/0_11_NODE_38_length_4465_cov_20_595346_g30_i0101655
MADHFTANEVQRILQFEAADFALKTDGMELPDWPEDAEMTEPAQPPTETDTSWYFTDSDSLDKRRQRRFREKALPLLEMVDMEGLTMKPLRMTELRETIYSTDPLPEGFEDFILPAKINQRRMDYDAKMLEDEDPQNEIEEQERLLSQHLQQWRVYRSIAYSGYPVYDTRNKPPGTSNSRCRIL